jgi:type II secretory pathway pseudopilin PulG
MSASATARCRDRRAAYAMVEVVISTLIVAIMLVAALNAVGAARVSMRRMDDHARGMLLAEDLLTEVLARGYFDPGDTPDFGPEEDEATDTRADFDDLDDYAGWSAQPPQYTDGSAWADAGTWRRTVVVDILDPTSLDPLEKAEEVEAGTQADYDIGDETGVRRVTVSVYRDDALVSKLVAVRTAVWAAANGTKQKGGGVDVEALLESLGVTAPGIFNHGQ